MPPQRRVNPRTPNRTYDLQITQTNAIVEPSATRNCHHGNARSNSSPSFCTANRTESEEDRHERTPAHCGNAGDRYKQRRKLNATAVRYLLI
jgi:hypothetical protein